MEKRSNKPAKTWQHLLAIPVMLILDVVVMILAVLADIAMANQDQLGHPAPVISMIALVVMTVITIILVLRSVVKMIRGLVESGEETDETE